jgi:hypothetical protein
MKKIKLNKKGQVWVETVIYTLIGITIIGILLAVAKPKIDSMKDKLVVDQTVESLNKINDKVYEVLRAPGNKRSIDLQVSKGRFLIDPKLGKISWTLDSTYKYSEPGIEITTGNIKVKTTAANPYKIELWIDYSTDSVDITSNGGQNYKELDQAPTPYSLFIENKGVGESGKTVIDFISE